MLVPAYAATIHKSQGSEIPRRDYPGPDPAFTPCCSGNLLYTGVTRGKKLVVLVGQKKAVAIAVGNTSAVGVVKLGEWLRGRLIVSSTGSGG